MSPDITSFHYRKSEQFFRDMTEIAAGQNTVAGMVEALADLIEQAGIDLLLMPWPAGIVAGAIRYAATAIDPQFSSAELMNQRIAEYKKSKSDKPSEDDDDKTS